MMFIHSDVLHPFTDAQSSCEFQQQEDDGRQGARPQNHHDAQDKLSTNGRATIACLAGSASGVHHATEATPAMVVILWGCSPLGPSTLGPFVDLGTPENGGGFPILK